MTLRSDHVKAAGGKRLFPQFRHLVGNGTAVGRRNLAVLGCRLESHVEIAAKLDVGAASGHVRGDGHRAGNAGLGDDLRLFGMEARVQHLVLYLARLQYRRQRLRFLDADSSDQDRLATVPTFGDQFDNGVITFPGCPVNLVIMIDPLDVDIGRYACHLETIDLREFAGLCHRRSGHAGQLLIESEIVLECHRCHGLVFGLDFQALARLDGLVKTFRETAPLHRAAGKFIDDHHLAVLDHVMAITLEKLVRLQRLVHMVKQPDILNVVERALAHRFGRS